MNPARREQIKRVHQSALEIEPDRRATFLRETCARDESLLKEVRSLLAQESGGLLDSPALNAARALAEEEDAGELPDLVGQTLRITASRRRSAKRAWVSSTAHGTNT